MKPGSCRASLVCIAGHEMYHRIMPSGPSRSSEAFIPLLCGALLAPKGKKASLYGWVVGKKVYIYNHKL